MMSLGLVLLAMIETAGLQEPVMRCAFPALEEGHDPIEIVMKGRPSLKDLPGLYRVEMEINGTGIRAEAQPIIGTKERDVLVRANTGTATFYAVGVNERGTAALNVVWPETDEAPERRMTRAGQCWNYERYIQTWSTS